MSSSQKDTLTLVTGGTGLVGSYLIRYLLTEGYTRIRALYRTGSRFDLVEEVKDRVEWVEADLLDIFGLEDAMEGVKRVYHCAALISFLPGERDLMLRTNRDGTANVVNACLHAGVEKLLYVSSIAAIGRDKKSNRINEATKWQRSPDNSYYAISKFQAEQEVWRGRAEGLPVVVVNPSVILGAGFWDSGPQQIFKMTWREFPFYPVGETGFVDVRDVARFMILLMESDIQGERYILNSTNTSFEHLQKGFAEAIDRRPPRYTLTPWMARWAARLEWLRSKVTGKHPLITRENALMTSLDYHYENDKSRRDLNFEYIPFEQTLEDIATLFKEAAEDSFNPKVLSLI